MRYSKTINKATRFRSETQLLCIKKGQTLTDFTTPPVDGYFIR